MTKDPVFLDEPYSKTMINLRNIKDPTAWLYACEDGEEIVGRAEEKIPNRLFGKNPFLREYADKNGVPLLGTLGGGQTIHPEFAAKLKDARSRRSGSHDGNRAVARARSNPAAP